VNGYPADTGLVRELVEGLDTARVGRLVARSASTHGRLGIGEESARRIEIGSAGDPAVAFLLGGGGPDGRYARFPPSDEVFAVPTASVRLLTNSVEEWRDRIVVAVDTSATRRIAVRRNDQPAPVFLTRGAEDPGASWTLDGSAADTAAVQANAIPLCFTVVSELRIFHRNPLIPCEQAPCVFLEESIIQVYPAVLCIEARRVPLQRYTLELGIRCLQVYPILFAAYDLKIGHRYGFLDTDHLDTCPGFEKDGVLY